MRTCTPSAQASLAGFARKEIEAALLNSTGSAAEAELIKCEDKLIDACRRAQILDTLQIPAAAYPPGRDELVAPAACGREVLSRFFVYFSWREPAKLLRRVARLQLFSFVASLALILLSIIFYRLLLCRRFRSGETKLHDVRDGECLRNSFGYPEWVVQNNNYAILPYGISGSQLYVNIARVNGMRIGSRVFVDRDVDHLRDGDLVDIGDDAVLCSASGIIGHDLTNGCHVMRRAQVSVPRGCRVGECARLGSGVVATSDVPPLFSSLPDERV